MRRPLWFLLLAACGVADADVASDDAPALHASEQSARVTVEQATQATAIVDSTKAYLPYAFTADGCYGRALYMAMELAGRRIPTSAQYLTGYLRPSSDVEWSWHVAPMVEIDGTAGRTILDPSLAPSGPVSLEQWVRLSNPQGGYTLYWTLGSEYFTDASARPNAEASPVIQSFAELTPFTASDISHACQVMYDYLGYEGGGSTGAKRQLLVRRTRTLLERLLSVGKLRGYASGSSFSCGYEQVPLCREASGACSASTDCCSMRCDQGACRARDVDTLSATTVQPSGPPSLVRGQWSGPFDAATGTELRFQVQVPQGVDSVGFFLSGNVGDADLYVRYGAPPTTSSADGVSNGGTSTENVTVTGKAGTWNVLVHAYSGFRGLYVATNW